MFKCGRFQLFLIMNNKICKCNTNNTWIFLCKIYHTDFTTKMIKINLT